MVTEVDVRVAAGVVRGRVEGGLAVFRGIPFAEPPVGELRFAAPRPVRGWDGVREAFAFGPPPPQDIRIIGRPGVLDAAPGDDWLTVNVWSPDADPAARRPVLVWIYGGAYRLGFSGSPGYDAQHVARDGDLVVVSFNYRLGVEGFTHLRGAPANRGLLDQVAALTWVRENIAAFGGDPEQVTVVGESAGAGSIAAMFAMPSAKGLFHQAVGLSVPGTFFTAELAEDVGTAIAAELNLAPTVADLSTVDPVPLARAGATLSGKMREHTRRWGTLGYGQVPFAPVVDGEVLTATPFEALAAGAGRDVPLAVGHSRDEYRLFIALAGQLGRITAAEASLALRVFGPGPDGERAYRAAFPEASDERLYELVLSDQVFRMPTVHLAQAQAAGGGRVHMYDLTWAGGAMGSAHTLASPLLFGTFGDHLGPMLFGREPSPAVEDLAASFRRAWTTFTATGDPGWPTYDDERLVQLFDTPCEIAVYPEETSRRLWQNHTFEALPLLTTP